MEHTIRAYGATAKQTATPRELEADLLLKGLPGDPCGSHDGLRLRNDEIAVPIDRHVGADRRILDRALDAIGRLRTRGDASAHLLAL
jgi:hypothetical protein